MADPPIQQGLFAGELKTMRGFLNHISESGLSDAVPKVQIKEGSRRTQRTRTEILAAAETLFSRRGYAVTRMEDVAEAVELTRTALFYHFRDKQTLYDAVLEDAFRSFSTRLQKALSTNEPIPVRILQAADVWIDALVERPTLARLLLWHFTSAEDNPAQRIFHDSDQVLRIAFKLFEDGCASGVLKPKPADPFFATSSVLGTTVIYLAALTSVTPAGVADSLGAQQLIAHKKDIFDTIRRLLGISASYKLKKKSAAEKTVSTPDAADKSSRPSSRSVKSQLPKASKRNRSGGR